MVLSSEFLLKLLSVLFAATSAFTRPYITNLSDIEIPEQKPFGMRIFLMKDHNLLNLAWMCKVPDSQSPIREYSRNISMKLWYNISRSEQDKEVIREGGSDEKSLTITFDHADVTDSKLVIAYINTTIEMRKNRTLTYSLTCGNTTTSVYELKYLYWDADEEFEWNMATVGSLGRFNSTLITLEILKDLRDKMSNLLLAVPGGIVADHTLKDANITTEVTWRDWVNWLLYFEELLATIPIVASPSELDIVPYTNQSYAKSHYKAFIEIPLDTPDKLDETLWYSFDHRNMHVVALCSFCDISDNSPQYKWLDKDLAANNASFATHWTMIIGHDPIYYESTSYDEDSLSILRKQVDKLLTKYKIDFAVWSHERWYERSYPMVSNLTVSSKNLHAIVYDPVGTMHYTCGTGGIALQQYNMGKYDYSAYFDSRYYGTCLFRKLRDDVFSSSFIHTYNKIRGNLTTTDDIEIMKKIKKPPPNLENHFTRFMKIFAIALVSGAVVIAVVILILRYVKKRDPSYIQNKIRNVRYRFRGSSNPSNLHVTLEEEADDPVSPDQDERDTVMLLEDETEPATINTTELPVWK